MSLASALSAFVHRKLVTLDELTFVKGRDYRYDDWDNFAVSYPYGSFDELVSKLRALGLSLRQGTTDISKAEVEIPEHSGYLQPKFVTVFGTRVHVLVKNGHITVTLFGDSGHLTPADVRAAEVLDRNLAMLKLKKRAAPLTMADLMK
jgi:hypothetical protein